MYFVINAVQEILNMLCISGLGVVGDIADIGMLLKKTGVY